MLDARSDHLPPLLHLTDENVARMLGAIPAPSIEPDVLPPACAAMIVLPEGAIFLWPSIVEREVHW